MVYLCKEDRKNAILKAAARVALDEGLAATTVRRVASAANTATGQVHHHFSSAAALRAEAYLLVMRNLQQSIAASSACLTPLERIQLYLIDAKDEEYIRAIHLWHEAMLLTEQDELMRTAFASSLSDWHRHVRQVINDGRKSGDFTDGECADDIAWRLIGLSSSLDGMSRLTSLGLTEQRLAYNLNRAIDIELRRFSAFDAVLTQGTV
ncbi:TetR family transcriptional regulator [Ewingella sp. S1.OA.A_B6]